MITVSHRHRTQICGKPFLGVGDGWSGLACTEVQCTFSTLLQRRRLLTRCRHYPLRCMMRKKKPLKRSWMLASELEKPWPHWLVSGPQNRKEARGFFCFETAVDCFNLSWEVYFQPPANLATPLQESEEAEMMYGTHLDHEMKQIFSPVRDQTVPAPVPAIRDQPVLECEYGAFWF